MMDALGGMLTPGLDLPEFNELTRKIWEYRDQKLPRWLPRFEDLWLDPESPYRKFGGGPKIGYPPYLTPAPKDMHPSSQLIYLRNQFGALEDWDPSLPWNQVRRDAVGKTTWGEPLWSMHDEDLRRVHRYLRGVGRFRGILGHPMTEEEAMAAAMKSLERQGGKLANNVRENPGFIGMGHDPESYGGHDFREAAPGDTRPNAPGEGHKQSSGWGRYEGEGGVRHNAPFRWGDPNSGMPSLEGNEDWVGRRGLVPYKDLRKGWYTKRGFPDKPPAGGKDGLGLAGMLLMGLGGKLAGDMGLNLDWMTPKAPLGYEQPRGSYPFEGVDQLAGMALQPIIDILSGEGMPYRTKPLYGPAFGPELEKMTRMLP